jgi:hypothetical protein
LHSTPLLDFQTDISHPLPPVMTEAKINIAGARVVSRLRGSFDAVFGAGISFDMQDASDLDISYTASDSLSASIIR